MSDEPTQLKPRLEIARDQAQSIIDRVAPRSSVLGITELQGGQSLTNAELFAIYAEMGAFLRRINDITLDSFGYIGPNGVWTAYATNRGYMSAQFDRKLMEFCQRGGDPALAERLRRSVAARQHLLDGAATPHLCHYDLHAGNVLVTSQGALHLSGIVDFENATAGDPLMDIAKALYYFTPKDAPKRDGLLAGYGAIERPDWQATIDLYRLSGTLEFWCWKAQIGEHDALAGLTKELENAALWRSPDTAKRNPSRRRTPFPIAGLSRYDGLSQDLRQAMKAGGGPTRSKRGATITVKRRQAPKTARVSSAAKTKVESPAKTEIEQLALELQEARERQAATAEVLSLISDSPTGIQPVFDRIVKNAARLCQSVLSAVYRRDGEHVDLVAHDQFSPESVAAVRKAYPAPLTSKNLISVAIRERRVVHEPDVLVSGGYSELQRTSGYRSILVVPMLRDEVAIGAIAVMRLEPQLFPRAQVELLKTFAGQAVIAIENTRLFTEVQERTRQLSQSLEDLRAAQDSLVQTEKLAALGRLVAGVAHELNTPVGTSLTVASAFLNKADRFEANVASGGVRRSTLTEFIAAGREAASQVMINLNHAIDLIQSFKQVAADRNVSDRRGFDLGEVTEQVVKGLRFGLRRNLVVSVECAPDLAMNSYPGPYGQVLTNLVINSAVHAFPDGARGSVQIAAQASGKHNVEVLFSDNGCGMSPEIKRQVFDPFFTTRRDQGSTGLGLHIVHNIVTNRLGGRINLETKPGAGTKIRIIVPREAPLAAE